jgi:hypothetical protein
METVFHRDPAGCVREFSLFRVDLQVNIVVQLVLQLLMLFVEMLTCLELKLFHILH